MAGTGRRGVWPMPRPPSELGDWGVSMYDDMLPLVEELNRRASGVSGTLDRHGDPVLVFRKEKQSMPDIPTGDTETHTVKAERMYLDEARGHATLVLPPKFEEAEYLVWDAQLQATFPASKERGRRPVQHHGHTGSPVRC